MDLAELIDRALTEDMPKGDITTDSLGVESRIGRARLIAKEDLVLSGVEVWETVMKRYEPSAEIKWIAKDGHFFLKGQTIATMYGNMLAFLKCERVALNFVGRLSGIATLTRCYVKLVEGLPVKIIDTRKTTPLLRKLEKKAVVDGGGQNHRMNLSDAIMIKDNHISMMNGITPAVQMIRKSKHSWIEVEAKTLAQVEECVKLKVDRIMLDNMSNVQMAEALKLIPSTIEVEASGNMDLERVRGVAELGVGFISIGALTHSAPTADLSLLFDDFKSPPTKAIGS